MLHCDQSTTLDEFSSGILVDEVSEETRVIGQIACEHPGTHDVGCCTRMLVHSNVLFVQIAKRSRALIFHIFDIAPFMKNVYPTKYTIYPLKRSSSLSVKDL